MACCRSSSGRWFNPRGTAVLEVGLWDGWDDIAGTWEPAAVIDPTPSFDRIGQRDRWGAALDRAAGWFGELSALDF